MKHTAILITLLNILVSLLVSVAVTIALTPKPPTGITVTQGLTPVDYPRTTRYREWTITIHPQAYYTTAYGLPLTLDYYTATKDGCEPISHHMLSEVVRQIEETETK